VGQGNGVLRDAVLATGPDGLSAGSLLGGQLLAELQRIRGEMHDLADTLLHRRADAAVAHDPAVNGRPVLAVAAPSGQPAATLYAVFFGSFSVFRNGERLPIGQSRTTGELCRYLIARNGEPVQRDEILELLWPDADPERALHRLHTAVSGLRRILDEPGAPRSAIQLEDDRYTIASDAVSTDYARFEAHYRQARAHFARSEPALGARALRSALRLYQGDYLGDQCYAEWTHQARAHFTERRLSALDLLAEYTADTGDLAGTLEYAGEILEIDGLRERAHRHVMRAHLALGQRACALRQYTRCAALLEQEIGVEPSRLTRQLYDAIRTDAELPPEIRLLD
jgi:LuxR family transcriptional regulator, maltose regulon positive regulatory protein